MKFRIGPREKIRSRDERTLGNPFKGPGEPSSVALCIRCVARLRRARRRHERLGSATASLQIEIPAEQVRQATRPSAPENPRNPEIAPAHLFPASPNQGLSSVEQGPRRLDPRWTRRWKEPESASSGAMAGGRPRQGREQGQEPGQEPGPRGPEPGSGRRRRGPIRPTKVAGEVRARLGRSRP